MELENNSTKHAYVQLLADTLRKKSEVLHQLMDITEHQEYILASEPFNEDQFLNTIDLKEEQIQLLGKLDIGFEQLYQSVKDELLTNKEKYIAEIAALKGLIATITDNSVKLQVMEKRNKSKIEVVLVKKRKYIRNSKISSKTATNYYKTMTQQHEAQSFFYDKKN